MAEFCQVQVMFNPLIAHLLAVQFGATVVEEVHGAHRVPDGARILKKGSESTATFESKEKRNFFWPKISIELLENPGPTAQSALMLCPSFWPMGAR